MELSALNIWAKVKADLSGIKPAVDDANKQLGGIGKGNGVSSGIESFVKSTTDSLKGINNGVSSTQKSFAELGKEITGVLSPILALGAAAVAASSDLNGAFREIRVGTGATGEQLNALKDNFAHVFSTVPASAKDAGAAIAELNQLTGATGTTLEGLATEQLNLARITGSELKPQIEATSRAFNNWGISAADQGSKLDYLFKVSQQTGIGVTDLAKQMSSSGGIARAAGLDFNTTAALVGQLSKNGIDATTVMGGFGKALKAIATKDPNADPVAVLQSLIQRIKDAGSESKQNAVAVEAFGKSGIQMAAAIRDGKLNIDQLVTSLRNSKDSINKAADDTRTFGESMTVLKNQVELALAPLGREMSAVLKSLMPDLRAVINIVTQLSDAFSKLPDSTKSAIAGIVLLGGAIGPALYAVGSLVAVIGGPLTLGLAALGAVATVMALDWAESMGKAGSSTGSLENELLELAKVVGTVMDVVGVLGHTMMAFFDITVGNLIGVVTAAKRAITGDFSGALDALREGSRQAALDFNQAWDEVNGKWSGRLQNMVSQAYAATAQFGAAGRASAAAYSAGLNSTGLGLKDPFANIPTPAKSFSETVSGMGAQIGGAASTAGTNAGTAAANKFLESFGKKMKGGGGGMGKAMVDAFEDGLAGLDAAIAKLSANSSKLPDLFDPVTKKAKAGAEEFKSALKVVADSVNEFFNAEGIKGAKLTIAQLASGWEKLQTVIGKAEAFKALKEQINDVNIDRLSHGLSTLDDTLKMNGNVVEISISTFKALSASHQDVIAKAEKLGYTFKVVFPAMGAEFKDLGARSDENVEAIQEWAKQFEFAQKRASESMEQTADQAPHWAGAIVDQAERIKKALAGDLPGAAGAAAAGLLQMRAALDIRSSIDGAISDIERYGEQLGLTGQALQDFVENKTRQELGKFKDINQADVDAAIEAHKKAAIQLPGIWGPVFDKLGSQSKSWAASVFGVLDSIPGAFGSTVKKVTDTINQWVNFFDKILGLLHKFSDSIPASVGDAIGSILGIFKQTQSGLATATTGIAGAYDAAKKAATGAGTTIAGSTSKMSAGVKEGFSAMAGAAASFTTALSVTAATGSKTMGIISSLFTSTLAGIQAGMAFGPIGGAVVGGISLIGGIIGSLFGKSAAQKEQERLQLEQQRQAVEKAKQDLEKGAQEVVQAALTTFQKAQETLEKLADYTKVPKQVFQIFFKDLGRLLDNFIELSKKFSGDLLDKAKKFADDMGPAVDVIAKAPLALEAIGAYLGVSDHSIDVFTANFSKVIEKLGTAFEEIPKSLQKHAKKFANNMAPVADLLGNAVSGLISLFDLKPITDEAFDIFATNLETVMVKVGDLAQRLDQFAVKQAARFADRAGAVTDLMKTAIDALVALATIKPVAPEAFDVLFNGISAAITRMSAMAENLSTEGLTKAEAVAQKSLAIFAAIKAGVEALSALGGYKGIAQQAIDDVVNDFKRAIDLLGLLMGEAEQFEQMAIKLEDHLKSGAAHIANGLAAMGAAIVAAAGALNGTSGGLEGGATGTSSGQSFGALSATSASSFGTLSLTPAAASASSSTTVINIGTVTVDGKDFQEMGRAVETLKGLGSAKRRK